MPVALRIRLADKKDEVLKYTKTYGRYRAMDKFDVADTIAFDRLLKEWTGDENYGNNPQISIDTRKTVGDQLLEAVYRKISKLEADNQRLKEQIEIYRAKISDDNKELLMADEIDRIFTTCGVENG
jgi:hypothetical protein